ncbi:hypothetical protein BKA63DRAFT_520156 [Paraphoma chrysanthemicola]|nr:hypothetical protein BKA63DRAFT_520156 [Paraphoma chrysanthemicola]
MRFSPSPFITTLAIALWSSHSVHAYPRHDELVVARAVNCNVVTGVLGVVKALGAPATSFCSSYLRVPATSTIKATITPTAYTTVTASPVVIQVTSASCPVAAAAVRRAVAELEKRDVPPALKLYAAAEISSACGCLSLKPKATTTMTATGSPVVVTATVTPTSTVCVDCTPVGLPCIFEQPERCCSQTCACISGVCNCYQFN